MTRYKDKKDEKIILMVRSGIGSGDVAWMTVRTLNDGNSGHRVVSPFLPLRKTSAEAQADLDAYAKKHKLVEII